MNMRSVTLFSLLALLMTGCGTPKPAETPAHPEWSYRSVVYELNVRQATPDGTFAAAADRLPALKELGVEEIYTGHCTGDTALGLLRERFGPGCRALATGQVLNF